MMSLSSHRWSSKPLIRPPKMVRAKFASSSRMKTTGAHPPGVAEPPRIAAGSPRAVCWNSRSSRQSSLPSFLALTRGIVGTVNIEIVTTVLSAAAVLIGV